MRIVTDSIVLSVARTLTQVQTPHVRSVGTTGVKSDALVEEALPGPVAVEFLWPRVKRNAQSDPVRDSD